MLRVLILIATTATILLTGCTDRTSAGGGNNDPQQVTGSRSDKVEAAESGIRGETAARAAELGKVLLLKPVDASSGRMDVFERNLDTNSSKVLISYKSFPETFVWPVLAIKPSPDGAYLAMIESVDALRGGGGRCWVWERKSRRISKVSDDPLGDRGFDWLSDSNRLLVHDDAGGIPWEGTYDGSVAIYDPATRKLNKLGSVKGLILAVPAGKGDILEVVFTKGDKSSGYSR